MPVANEKPKTIAGLLTDPKIKQQIALALPRHMTADRLARIALTEIRKVPKLTQCDQTSFLGAIMQCAALGLEPGGALGHCYLIPFENRRQNRTEVQFIIGYRGMIDLARRSGQIVSLTARAVRERDEFAYTFGLDENVEHTPADGDRGEITYVYAVAKLKDGGVQFEVMSMADVRKVRDESQGYKTALRYAKPGQPPNTPWHDHFEAMALKTVTRRLFKWLPVSIEIQHAILNDERADAGVPQESPLVIEGVLAPAGDASTPADSDASMSVPEVLSAIESAEDVDALDSAYDMLSLVNDATADERRTVTDAYNARRAVIETEG
jgi:recombination protein RecT